MIVGQIDRTADLLASSLRLALRAVLRTFLFAAGKRVRAKRLEGGRHTDVPYEPLTPFDAAQDRLNAADKIAFLIEKWNQAFRHRWSIRFLWLAMETGFASLRRTQEAGTARVTTVVAVPNGSFSSPTVLGFTIS